MGVASLEMKKVVEAEEADRKLERAIRAGLVNRYLGADWLKEAEDKGVLNRDEADLLRYTERLIAKAIAVDDFDAEEVKPHYVPGDNVRAVAAATALSPAASEAHAAE